jgi:hypothetical protein
MARFQEVICEKEVYLMIVKVVFRMESFLIARLSHETRISDTCALGDPGLLLTTSPLKGLMIDVRA